MAPARDAILGCIVAGGQSRRMGGGDKALRTLAGRPMLAHVVDRLRPQVAQLILNANGDPQRFEEFALPVVADTVGDFSGPLAGVLAAMRHAENNPGFSRIATAAADTPFFPSDLVERLSVEADNSTVVLATSDGNRHPVFGLWPISLADDLENWLGSTDTYKVLAWIGRHRLRTVDFPLKTAAGLAVDPFFNANTPEDMLQAERYMKELQV